MAHFAKVLDGKVVEVIVAEQDFIDNLIDTSPGEWIQTSYNTKRGIHSDGGTPLRGNFAGVGFSYEADIDAFMPPKEYTGWIRDDSTFSWVAPIPYPDDDDNIYVWDNDTESWVIDPNSD